MAATAVEKAACEGRLDLAAMLLERGAIGDLAQVRSFRSTISWAESCAAVAELLEEHQKKLAADP
jgi:hypothetical protein